MAKKYIVLVGVVVLTLLASVAASFAQTTGDPDGDGVSNRIDHCPTQPGPLENHGCPLPDNGGIPDKDSDGVADFVDQCPEAAGTGFTEGCPVNTIPDATPVVQPANPQPVMVWDSTEFCRVGVPLTAAGNMNIREQPTTGSSIIGHLVPGDQFEPFFRDYDENNAVWFGGAPAGDGWGWVADSVVIDNGQCASLPMILHVDAPGDSEVIANVGIGNLDLIPRPLPTDAGDGLLPDVLTWEGTHVLVVGGEAAQTERAGRTNPENYMIFTLKEVIIGGGGCNPCPTSAPPPSPAPPPARALPVVIQIIGVLIGTEPEPLPTSEPSPTRPLPVLLVIADMNDSDCVPVGSGYCLRMMFQLPDFDDPQGQCSPDSDNARALPRLLEAAIKGKVFKKVEIHGTAAQSGDGSVMPAVMMDGDGSVMPVGDKDSDSQWDYGCSIIGFVPTGETEAMGDGSVRFHVDTFVVLPAVQGG
jgi:hypothetical protein